MPITLYNLHKSEAWYNPEISKSLFEIQLEIEP